jgi:radical SAM superfamily enzyme YgiQ (UPF0313 family)
VRIGILDILALPLRHPGDAFYHLLITKQFAGITPQAIAVWCRRLGHQTFYATYYGMGRDARRLLPSDLDIVFIAAYTQASPMAYALARLYGRSGTRTVIGGPHAKAFPADCLRFFDFVVRDCDEQLIKDILSGHFDPGTVLDSGKPLEDLPSVEERWPEIRASAFYFGVQPLALSCVPMLTSVGCPYQCDFCIDWDTPYRALPPERLAADLRFLAERSPGTAVFYQDPNFAIKFDQVFAQLEALPRDKRPPYLCESSLTVLRGERPRRLGETHCICVAPGIESWTDYSNKSGAGQKSGVDKVRQVAEQFRVLAEHVPYLQANFIFGLDTDAGEAPVELTKLFMDEAPHVWPVLNIPMPFGGTPLHDKLVAQGRVLRSMPFAFYYAPYLVMTLKHYDPVTYYEKLIELFSHAASPSMLKRRLRSTRHLLAKAVHVARTASARADLGRYRALLRMLRTDAQFRAFHEGRSAALPEYYRRQYRHRLGGYAELLGEVDLTPNLAQHRMLLRGAA